MLGAALVDWLELEAVPAGIDEDGPEGGSIAIPTDIQSVDVADQVNATVCDPVAVAISYSPAPEGALAVVLSIEV